MDKCRWSVEVSVKDSTWYINLETWDYTLFECIADICKLANEGVSIPDIKDPENIWQFALKMINLNREHSSLFSGNLEDYSYKEAKSIYDNWMNEIHVGDIVRHKLGSNEILITEIHNNGLFSAIDKDGVCLSHVCPDYWTKTGRRIPLDKIIGSCLERND